MTITIRIETGNAAFEGNKSGEVALIVGKVSQLIRQRQIPSGVQGARRLLDSNGNVVGTVTVTGK